MSARSMGRRERIDAAVVTALVVACVVGFGPAFGGTGYLVAAGAGLVVGMGLAWVSAWRRIRVIGTTALTMIAYLAVGGAVALPSTTIAHVLPTVSTLRGLLRGAATSWMDLVTATPPLGSYAGLLVVPFLATLVVTVVAASIALRAPRPAWALVPVAVLLVGVILLGTPQPAVPVAQGLAIALVGLTWASWRSTHDHRPVVSSGVAPQEAGVARRLRTRRAAGALGLLVAAGLVAAGASAAVAPATPRTVLRDTVVPPLELHDFPSPLVGFRKYVKDEADTVLFTVTGLPTGQRLRLAVMDAYTGTVYDVAGGQTASGSGGFTRAGSTLARGTLDNLHGGTPATLTVTVGDYRDVWVPDAGLPSAITFEGGRAETLTSSLHYNPEASMALATARLQKGDRYQVTTVLPVVPEAGDLTGRAFAATRLPTPVNVPESVGVAADTDLGGASGPAEQVENLRDALVTAGILSHGLESDLPSRAGHGSNRIDTLLTAKQMVGDDEQFAVAMALMARQLGIPARVVMGFYPAADAPATDGTFEVHGSDVHAWVEVAFDGVGWVTFDPIPDAEVPPQDQDPRSQSEPQPQQLQQPPPPEEPAEPPTEPLPESTQDEQGAVDHGSWFAVVGRVAAVALPLILVASPFLLVLAAKSRRHARRRNAASPVDRLTGGWREVMDTALDHGLEARYGATRRETAVTLAVAYPESSVLTLAHRVDAGVFGPSDPEPDEVDAVWQQVDEALAQIAGSVGSWRRLRARLSLRSLRRGLRRSGSLSLASLSLVSLGRGSVAAGSRRLGSLRAAAARRGRRPGQRPGERGGSGTMSDGDLAGEPQHPTTNAPEGGAP